MSPDEEAQIPAQEAGVLTKILVHEGEQVAAKQPLAQVDDIIPRMQREMAYYKFQAASKKAATDVDIRFAEEAAKVAKVDYDQAVEANRKVSGTFTQSELLRRLLDWHKMGCRSKKRKRTASSPRWRRRWLKPRCTPPRRTSIAARLLARPGLTGRANRWHVVVELTQHVGQWVQSGEPVMRLVRMDRLRVNGVVDAKMYRPSEIQDRAVEIAVTLPRLGRQTFAGKVVYVKPVIESDLFQVRAEVENRKQNGVWILNPGMNVEMTIQLK